MKNSLITYHHIGGRNGTYPLPIKNSILKNDFHLILYDADVDCYAQMNNNENSSFLNTSIFPFCIADETKLAKLNVNFHPTTSSLLDFNNAYADFSFIPNSNYGDYRLGDACKLKNKVDVQLFTLKDAVKKTQQNSIDILSLDIQGAEYGVIKGAKELIENKCIAVHLEVEFFQLYKKQKTFFEINALLDQLGFELIDLHSIGKCSPISLPIGFRAEEKPVYGEAVYIKKYNLLKNKKNILEIYKYCLICLIYKNTGYAIQALKYLGNLTDLNTYNSEDTTYITFLKQVWQDFQKQNFLHFPKLSELFTEEIFSNFYLYGSQKNKYINQLSKKMLDNIRQKYLPMLANIKTLIEQDTTSFEALLLKYGLPEVATVVKSNRLKELQYFQNLLVPFKDA